MLSATEYRAAVEEFDRRWSNGSIGECTARMDALLAAIEEYERALEEDGCATRAGDCAPPSAA